jgi:hypothetical protein
MRVSHCHFQRHSDHIVWSIVLIVVCCIGCGRSRSEPLPVYPVKGEVFVGGKPAEGAVIAFYPTKRTEWSSTTSRGVVDQRGGFSLTTYEANDGAPEGEYVVTVYWPERPLDPSGEGNDLPADQLGGRFAKLAHSNLRVRLGQQPVTLARVDLKDNAAWKGQEFHFVEQEP